MVKAKGRLRGTQPKLRPNQAKYLLELHDLGTYMQAELAELFGAGRSRMYHALDRMRARHHPSPSGPSPTSRIGRRHAVPEAPPAKVLECERGETQRTRRAKRRPQDEG